MSKAIYGKLGIAVPERLVTVWPAAKLAWPESDIGLDGVRPWLLRTKPFAEKFHDLQTGKAEYYGFKSYVLLEPKSKRIVQPTAQQGLYSTSVALQIGALEKENVTDCQRAAHWTVSRALSIYSDTELLDAANKSSWALFDVDGQRVHVHNRSHPSLFDVTSLRQNLHGAAFGSSTVLRPTVDKHQLIWQTFMRHGIMGVSEMDLVDYKSTDPQIANYTTEGLIMPLVLPKAMNKYIRYQFMTVTPGENMIKSLLWLSKRGITVPVWAWSSSCWAQDRTRNMAGLCHQLTAEPCTKQFVEDVECVMTTTRMASQRQPPSSKAAAITMICGAIVEALGSNGKRAHPCGCPQCAFCKQNTVAQTHE